MMAGRALAFVFLLIVLLHNSLAVAAVEEQKEPAMEARKDDIDYIRCQVCTLIVPEISMQVRKVQQECLKDHHPLSHWFHKALSKVFCVGHLKKLAQRCAQVLEQTIQTISEEVCRPDKERGRWISRIDIVENGHRLELVKQSEEGCCFAECKTIQAACEQVMQSTCLEYDYKAIAGEVYRSFGKYVCESWRSSTGQWEKVLKETLCNKECAKDPPPVPNHRVPGEPFARMSANAKCIPGAPTKENDFGAEDDEDNIQPEGKVPTNTERKYESNRRKDEL